MTEHYPTSRDVGDVTLHLHQLVHIADADPEHVPWFPSDYVVVDLAVSLGDEDGSTDTESGIRLVGLPLDDDSPVAMVTIDYADYLFATERAVSRYADGSPVWGY